MELALALRAVELKTSSFNLQRLYVPRQSCPVEELGKYCWVGLNDSSIFLCRIFQHESLQSDCCLLEKSVQSSSGILTENAKLISLKFIPALKIFKTLKVSVVLNDIEDALLWKDKRISVVSLVTQLLRLFVISSGCHINLGNYDPAKRLGIVSIIILNAGTPHPGKVTSSTNVVISDLISAERFSLRKPTEKIELPGCSRAYEQLKDFLSFRSLSSGNKLAMKRGFSQLIVVGPVGCGKKTLIQKVATEFNAVVVRLDCTRLSSPKTGDAEALIGRTFNRATSLANEGLVILLLLHMETVCHKQGRILDAINALLDSVSSLPNLIVATSSSDPSRIHESIKTGCRLDNTIYIGVPSEAERAAMLKVLCRNEMPLTDEMYEELARATPGYVMADLSLIVNNAKRKLLNENGVFSSNCQETFSVMKTALSQLAPSALRGELGVIKSDFSITELGGLHQIKETLLRSILWPLRHEAAFKKFNINCSSGVLLYGPPGCAKTSLARAVAAGSNVTFLAVSAADLYSPFVGDTERTISSLFQRARAAAPTVLFIDEIDALVGNRDGGQRRAQERVLSSFLMEMDGICGKKNSESQCDRSESRVVIIAATNRPDTIDAALLRPGRFDKLIHVPPPDVDDRLDILKVITRRMPLSKDVELRSLAEIADLHSGADLSNLCCEAALHALTDRGIETAEITQGDFLRVLSTFEPSLNASMVRWYKDFSFA